MGGRCGGGVLCSSLHTSRVNNIVVKRYARDHFTAQFFQKLY